MKPSFSVIERVKSTFRGQHYITCSRKLSQIYVSLPLIIYYLPPSTTVMELNQRHI